MFLNYAEVYMVFISQLGWIFFFFIYSWISLKSVFVFCILCHNCMDSLFHWWIGSWILFPRDKITLVYFMLYSLQIFQSLFFVLLIISLAILFSILYVAVYILSSEYWLTLDVLNPCSVFIINTFRKAKGTLLKTLLNLHGHE